MQFLRRRRTQRNIRFHAGALVTATSTQEFFCWSLHPAQEVARPASLKVVALAQISAKKNRRGNESGGDPEELELELAATPVEFFRNLEYMVGGLDAIDISISL